MDSNQFWIKNLFFGDISETYAYKNSAISMGYSGAQPYSSLSPSIFVNRSLSDLISNTFQFNSNLLFASSNIPHIYLDNWKINLSPLITGTLPSPFVNNNLETNSLMSLNTKFAGYDFHETNINSNTLFEIVDGTTTTLENQEIINSLTSMFSLMEPQNAQISDSILSGVSSEKAPDMFQKMEAQDKMQAEAATSYFQPLNISLSSMFQFNLEPFTKMSRYKDSLKEQE